MFGFLDFPIGKYKENPPEADFFDILAFPQRGIQSKIGRRRILLKIKAFPYRAYKEKSHLKQEREWGALRAPFYKNKGGRFAPPFF